MDIARSPHKAAPDVTLIQQEVLVRIYSDRKLREHGFSSRRSRIATILRGKY